MADSRSTHWIMFLLLCAALALRLTGLTDYAPTMDESQFIIISHGRTLTDVWQRSLAETHPPLVWFLRHFLLELSDNPLWQRLLSVIVGMGSILAAYVLGREACRSRETGLVSAMCVAFTPGAIIASMGIRNYGFLTLFLLLSWLFLIRWNHKRKTHNIVLYSVFITFACASHFCAFLMAGALGTAQGITLLARRQGKPFLLFCTAQLPAILLLLALWHPFFSQEGTLTLWKHFTRTTEDAYVAGDVTNLSLTKQLSLIAGSIWAYFSPYINAVRYNETRAAIDPSIKAAVLIAGIMGTVMYISGLHALWKRSAYLGVLVCTAWVFAISAAFLGAYPFSANRHSLYLLPAFALPMAMFAEPYVKNIRFAALFLILPMIILFPMSQWARLQDNDFCLPQTSFTKAQEYLHTSLKGQDAVVTGWVGAYTQLLRAQDGGKTPYHDYTDKAFINGSVMLAPYGSPFRPYHDWQPFRQNLLERISGGVGKGGKYWFVQYGWRNPELWAFMQCEATQKIINDFTSMDGVAIYSIETGRLKPLLEDTRALKECFMFYIPSIVAEPIGNGADGIKP